MVSQGPGVREHLLRLNLMQDTKQLTRQGQEQRQYHWTYVALRRFSYTLMAIVFWAWVIFLALQNAL